MATCRIKWIDCEGKPTGDEREAVGEAVFKATGDTFPICEVHLATMRSVFCHHDARCHHYAADGFRGWTFRPYAAPMATDAVAAPGGKSTPGGAS